MIEIIAPPPTPPLKNTQYFPPLCRSGDNYIIKSIANIKDIVSFCSCITEETYIKGKVEKYFPSYCETRSALMNHGYVCNC